MFEGLDGERVSSYVLSLVVVVLVVALVLDAARVGATVAGSIFAAYAVTATVYLLLRGDAGRTE